jgi:KipI family sensor histidine kinase inhibitor
MIARPMHFAAAGDRGLLVTGGPDFRPAAAALALKGDAHVLAAVVGHESLLVIGDAAPDRAALAARLERASESRGLETRTHRFNVAFDGADFEEFLTRVGISRDDFLASVRDVRLTVRYLGFRGGFGYCDGWPEAWRLPRRPTSRNRVPRGTFAIAGAMAGFYPEDSPGGWNLLGTTDALLWDPNRQPPNLLQPGDVFSLTPVDSVVAAVPTAVPPRADGPVVAEVVMPGQLTTIVGPRDWRRASAGLTPGGPFDASAAAAANRAAGNPDDAPLLECVLVAPRLQLHRRAAFCDGALNVRIFAAGEETEIGSFRNGLRGYLAIEGGVEGGGIVKKGHDLHTASRTDVQPGAPAATAQSRDHATTIRVIPGPHDAPPLPRQWQVTNQLDRVGIRLTAIEPVTVTLPADLPSLGMQFGTLQWHPNGSVIAMGPDHPVTGGYLQPATVVSSDLWKLAQLAPGERVTFVDDREGQ